MDSYSLFSNGKEFGTDNNIDFWRFGGDIWCYCRICYSSLDLGRKDSTLYCC